MERIEKISDVFLLFGAIIAPFYFTYLHYVATGQVNVVGSFLVVAGYLLAIVNTVHLIDSDN